MNRIDDTFAKLAETDTAAFVAFVAAGDPNLEQSLEIIKALANAGADIIELGVPFSDPLADGVVNQLAAERALKAGTTLPKVLQLIRDFRKTHETPIVLFTYLNPIYIYGYDKFHADAAEAGADGVLLLDLPPDEAKRNNELAKSEGLKHITLIAPNCSASRIQQLAEPSEGFIYALSRTGVTGARAAPQEGIGEIVQSIKQHTKTPVCIGFGINSPDQAKMVADVSDGVVVGSAIVSQVAKNHDNPRVADVVATFAKPLIQATKST